MFRKMLRKLWRWITVPAMEQRVDDYLWRIERAAESRIEAAQARQQAAVEDFGADPGPASPGSALRRWSRP